MLLSNLLQDLKNFNVNGSYALKATYTSFGVCVFDNDLCGFHNDTTGTLVWDFLKSADNQIKKHNFPKHDHTSMTGQGSYILLKSNQSTKYGYGRLVKQWNITVTACLQFWYFVPSSDCQLEIAVRTDTRMYLLWNTSNSTAGTWSFGQVQLPGNSTGKIIVTGYVNKDFVALDDVGFVQGACASVSSQGKPSFYEDKKNTFNWDMLSPIIHPKAEGWRCLRFWFYSGKKYFGRKLIVEFHSDNETTEEWSYSSATDKWTFIQLPISGKQESLQVRILGQKDNLNAILTINGLTFSKEPCLKIPAHQECHEYETLSYSDRREDAIAKDATFRGCDDHLSMTAWYRVVDSAGRQLASSCIDRKSYCTTEYMGWINGPHPSVEDGVVERQLCFSSGDKCCIKETIVKIRNCKGYFVYQFPRKVPICPSKYCTVYKLEWADSRVGVSDRNIIPDDKFTASSQKDGTIYKTHYARLHGRDGAWEPRTNDDPNEYLQIDLGAVFIIRAVATQGSPDWTGWTREYKISTSVDSDSWTLYQSRGQVKVFSGNKDRNSVVKNTLDGTRTLGRFIRFIPTQYKIWKVLRVEVYGNRLNESLHSNNTQNEWQGWLKGRDKKVQWKILDEISYEKATSSIKVSRRPQGENFTQDYESDIGFSLVHQNHSVSAKIRQTLEEMTICLWTSINSSSPTIISVSYVNEEKEKTAIAFVKIEDTARNGTRKWIHICVTWMSNFGVWQTYIDGAAIDNGLGMLDTQELKRGNRISITFDSQDHQTEVKYSRLNIWKDVLSKQDILYMSYICGSETGDLLGWKDYLKLLPRASSGFGIYNSTCRGKQGNVMSLIGASSPEAPTSLARIESPRFQRSSESPGRCLKFKYKMWGPGAKVIIIYQEFDNKEYSKRPIWMVKDSDDNRWRDGQVTLTAVTAYKLAIEGEVTNRPGLMSIGALHTTEGYCTDIIPPSARQACNEILSNTAGYIVSPYYPGYYENNARCTWTIEASKGHLIRLEFKTFELESSQRCSADFVEVYDGEAALSSSRIGRYCGSRYQEIIQSQSDTIKITFSSNNDVTRSGFKAYYQIIKDAEDDGCVQDCPLSCTCRKAANTSGIIVTSRQLRSIPYRLPKNTRAILFSGSKIHQVKSNAFHRLSHLSLIDLSLNRIFVVEEMSFVNLPSLKILRMNGNFIKEVWRNMFSGLEQLESMDLGENFISNIKWDAFSGFPGLRALSLRSNQINKLHKLTFQNTTNLTYLYLQNNALKSIPAGLFRQQKYLEILLLHQNDMQRIDKSTFEGLINLRKLSLKNNSINEQTLSNDVFKNLQKLEYLSTDSFIMCCYATKSIPNLNCVSPGNEFSSCDDMLKSIYVQICIWVEGVLATFGNLAVVSWWIFLSTRRRRTKRKINSVQSLLFCHLAFADLLMGIYLLMIATYNELWKGEYFLHDVEWRAGIKCEIAGAIATLSSEVSVMVLVAIAADRINTIVFQLSSRRTNLKMAHVLCLFIWVIGFVISFTPLLAPSYFNDKISGFRFYGRSTVCLPLQLSNDRPAGWEYSVAVFIAFNGAAFFFILVGYIAIFIKVRKSARNVRSSSSSESAVGKRVLFVILTDFFCWMPVVVLGLLSLVHDFNDPSVYVWVAVFVLPVNSAINPVLYTFSSAQTINTMKSIRRRWRNEQTPQTRPAQAMPLKEFRSPEREDPEQIVSQGLDTRL